MPFCFHIIKEFYIASAFFRWLVSFSSENTSETYCHMNTGFVRKLAILSVNCLLLGIFAPAFLTATRPRYHFWLYTDAGSYVFCEITQRFRESSLSVFQKRADCLRIAIPTGQVSSLRCSYCICPRSHPTCFIYLAVSQKSLSRDSMRAKLNITPRTSRKNQLAATSPQKTSRSKPCLLAGHAAAT